MKCIKGRERESDYRREEEASLGFVAAKELYIMSESDKT